MGISAPVKSWLDGALHIGNIEGNHDLINLERRRGCPRTGCCSPIATLVWGDIPLLYRYANIEVEQHWAPGLGDRITRQQDRRPWPYKRQQNKVWDRPSLLKVDTRLLLPHPHICSLTPQQGDRIFAMHRTGLPMNMIAWFAIPFAELHPRGKISECILSSGSWQPRGLHLNSGWWNKIPKQPAIR